MPLSSPTISVVIPTYNPSVFLVDALESVWAQTLLPDEIIVVDDHSTDGTAERLAQLAARSPVPMKLIFRDENSGSPARPMNDGVARARGNFVAVLDHDDVWLPTKLQRQSEALHSQPNALVAFSLHGTLGRNLCNRWRKARWTPFLTRRMKTTTAGYHGNGPQTFDLFVQHENFVGGFPGFMFRHEAWQQKGGFDESFDIAIDYDFLCWCCRQSDAMFVPELHYLRREHGNNLTQRELPRLLDVIRILLRYIPPAEMQSSEHYERALKSKFYSLVRHLNESGCNLHAAAVWSLLQAMSLRQTRWVWPRYLLHLVDIFAGRMLRVVPPHAHSTEAEAAAGVAQLERLLAENGLLTEVQPAAS